MIHRMIVMSYIGLKTSTISKLLLVSGASRKGKPYCMNIFRINILMLKIMYWTNILWSMKLRGCNTYLSITG